MKSSFFYIIKFNFKVIIYDILFYTIHRINLFRELLTLVRFNLNKYIGGGGG